jgi:hypothetical protein
MRDLLVGGTLNYNVDCTVPEAFGGLLITEVTAIGPGESVDPDPADNRGVDETVVLAAGTCGTWDHRLLVDLSVASEESYQACSSIRVGGNVRVEATGALTLWAPLVRISSGLVVRGQFQAGALP